MEVLDRMKMLENSRIETSAEATTLKERLEAALNQTIEHKAQLRVAHESSAELTRAKEQLAAERDGKTVELKAFSFLHKGLHTLNERLGAPRTA